MRHLEEPGQRMSSGAAAAARAAAAAPVQPDVLAAASPRYGTDLSAAAMLHMENVLLGRHTPLERRQSQAQKPLSPSYACWRPTLLDQEANAHA